MIVDDSRPIGVFDSGVGGLSVLKELTKTFPNESFVYLGDTARLPYGSKSAQTIKKYVLQNIKYLIKFQDIKAVVIACNSASTVLSDLEFWEDLPLFGVIEPGAKVAVATTKNKKIAVWATRATTLQGSYEKAINFYDSKIQCTTIACPLLVPLVEDGHWEGPIVDSIIDLYLMKMNKTEADTLILGCTHYPFIKNTIEKRIHHHCSSKHADKVVSLNPKLKIVDSAKSLCGDLKLSFNSGLIKKSAKDQSLSFLFTDEATHFMDLALKSTLDWKNIKFQLIDLHQIV